MYHALPVKFIFYLSYSSNTEQKIIKDIPLNLPDLNVWIATEHFFYIVDKEVKAEKGRVNK